MRQVGLRASAAGSFYAGTASRADRCRRADRATTGARDSAATSAGRHRRVGSWLLRGEGYVLRSRLLPSARLQGRQKVNEDRHFVRADLRTIRGHISPARSAVADLVDELVGRQARADKRQVGPALSADTIQSMAIAA